VEHQSPSGSRSTASSRVAGPAGRGISALLCVHPGGPWSGAGLGSRITPPNVIVARLCSPTRSSPIEQSSGAASGSSSGLHACSTRQIVASSVTPASSTQSVSSISTRNPQPPGRVTAIPASGTSTRWPNDGGDEGEGCAGGCRGSPGHARCGCGVGPRAGRREAHPELRHGPPLTCASATLGGVEGRYGETSASRWPSAQPIATAEHSG
jgi:hypothetical protein